MTSEEQVLMAVGSVMSAPATRELIGNIYPSTDNSGAAGRADQRLKTHVRRQLRHLLENAGIGFGRVNAELMLGVPQKLIIYLTWGS